MYICNSSGRWHFNERDAPSIFKISFYFSLTHGKYRNEREESFELVELNKIAIGHRLIQHSIPSFLKYSVSFKVLGMSAEKKKPYRLYISERRIQLSKIIMRISRLEPYNLSYRFPNERLLWLSCLSAKIEITHTHTPIL